MKTIKYDGLSSKTAKKDIKYCLKNQGSRIFTGDYSFFDGRLPLYLNTNDSVKSVVPDMASEGGKILTMASSGDYLLESIFNGASEVTTFDINKFQYYVSQLKVWAVQTLSYEEYVNFFHNPCSFDFLSPEIIDTILKEFKDEPASIFWDEFKNARNRELRESQEKKYQSSDSSRQAIFEKWLDNVSSMNEVIDGNPEAFWQYKICSHFGPLEFPRKFRGLNLFGCKFIGPKFCDFSSSEDNYKLTRENLEGSKIAFINSDLLLLGNHLGEEEFDGAFLSNIPYYLSPQQMFLSFSRLFPLIKTDGFISYYLHNMRKNGLMKLTIIQIWVQNFLHKT